ncbi:zinc finger and BTB domain-containing protein 10 [Protopterus annectens]|uniref:zinc finger and BTB domain-containing protein 10 n=1 Tax=Protopterus annectens TaxID=7888 RepID=UPI001CFA36E9|nr:zinc finger and BTB domain-containing protein 10 [Protopterus annectens]
MSVERNRRSLAFRGGGLPVVSCVPSNSGDIAEWRQPELNGRRMDEEVEELETVVRTVEEGGSISDSTEDEELEGVSVAGDGLDCAGSSGDRRSGDGQDEGEGSSVGAGDSGEGEVDHETDSSIRRSGVGVRPPQPLLQKVYTFQGDWLQEFEWLNFDQETGLMSCAWCYKPGGSDGQDEVAKGTRNYKRPLLLRHHLSVEHRMKDPAKQHDLKVKTESAREGYTDYSRPNENSYCYQLLQELNEQRKKGILCDVRIVVSGKVFRAHKNILVAGSRFFKTLYCYSKKASHDQATVTHLDVVAVQGFSVILDFMYSGNLVLTSQNAIEVMSVASYLQMTEVVQSCRNFIKDALNISIKSEAPEAVVVDYNRRTSVTRDALSLREQKTANFWATHNLTNLASHIKNEDRYSLDESQNETFQLNDPGWGQSNSLEMVDNEPVGQGKVFVWNDMYSQTFIKQEPGSGRRKNQTARRFVYNIPLKVESPLDNTIMQPSMSYSEEDLQIFQDDTGESSAMAVNKLKCPHCNYIAKYRRTLKRHLLIHTGVRSFSCDICGKLFTRREHVKRHSLVHKKDKKYKCMVCKKIFMLAASVGIRHGSRRYGVCVDCADKSQQGNREGVDQVQDLDFPRDEDEEEETDNLAVEVDEDLMDEGEEPNDQSQWEQSGEVCVTLDD